jgi:peptide/nickel transport system permease protein
MALSAQQEMENKELHEGAPRKHVNWPFMVGLILVAFVTYLAIAGPSIAPKDPQEEHTILMIEGEWEIPPFDIGTPGYPLGSDEFGRDLLSRILVGTRPTMVMVIVVAVFRLIIGVIIGLSAGWFSGRTARFLDSLIQIALALPVLLVALGAIAIVGVELGIWAFIIGLSLTGWVDTALQVREQTRIVKKQAYVEAATALGAANHQILSNHILKQISPMLLMLFAFEVSSTLMLTAGLGFLGYYIGGDVWVDVDDFVARRISGESELGQMLATSWVTLTRPWAMVAVGTTIFISVLGFNLIGEGLRQSMGFAKVQRKRVITNIRYRIGLWFDHHIWHPLVQFFRITPLRLGFAGITAFFMLSLGAILLLDAAAHADVSKVLAKYDQMVAATPPESQPASIRNPDEGQVVHTISYDPTIVWEIKDENGFSGGPTVSPERDHLYLVSKEGVFYALDLNGNQIWKVDLPFVGIGTPAIGDDGDIYVADEAGGLNKISPQGEKNWRYQSDAGDRSHSGPSIGPDGTIYYTAGAVSKGYVQAVSPSGEDLWLTQAETPLFFETPIPSQDGQYVFLKNDIFSADSGELLKLETDLKVLRFFSGEDGKNYMLVGQKIIHWKEASGAIEVIDIAEWDSSIFPENTYSTIVPTNVGVTDEGIAWLLYTFPGGDTTLVWVSMDDIFLGVSDVSISGSNPISIQPELKTIICGGEPFNTVQTHCAALTPSSEQALWKFHPGDYGPVMGGVVVDERLFFATEDGYVFEVNENYDEITASIGTDAPPPITSSPTEKGVIWTYQATSGINYLSPINMDGSVLLTTADNKLHIISSDGQTRKVIQMEPGPYHQESETGRSAPINIDPIVMPDETIIVVSQDSSVYALDLEGNQLWEQHLEAAPARNPLLDEKGNLYLLDEDAGLYLFNNKGLLWRFQSEAAPMPANGHVIGPEGNSYYTVTDYGKVFIQAVSPDGVGLWATRAKTREIYDELKINTDGRFVSIAEDLLDAQSGELLEVDPGERVNEIIFGLDGRNYARALHTIWEWQAGPSGLEYKNKAVVSEGDTTIRQPLFTQGDSNGIIWVYYPSGAAGGAMIIVWITPEGELLGRYQYDRYFHFGRILNFNLENSSITECTYFEETSTLECAVYSPNTDEPKTILMLEYKEPFAGGIVIDDNLYIVNEDNVVTKIYIEAVP